MLTKCNHCGEVAVDDTENQDVCHSCGIVAQETKLSCSDYTPFVPRTYTPYTRFEAKVHRKKKGPVCLLHGLDVLDHLCHDNNVSANLKTEIADLFKNICAIRNYRFKEDAAVTAACCLFLILRKNQQAIPIKRICHQAQCTRGKFSFYLRFVKSYLSAFQDEEISSLNPLPSLLVKKEDNSEDYVSDILISLIREICNKAEREEKTKLMEKVTALVKLVDDCWILTGRSPRSVVVACAYLCWKSMNPLRKKASFPKFCSTFEINEPIAKRRIPELQAFLLKLGQKIPSYNENSVNKDNLVFHLDIILENSETLRNDLLPDVHASEAVNCREYSVFRFPSQTKHRKEPLSSVVYESDMNASDIEISDTEIQSYIVSDSKKKFIELCKKKKD